MFDLSGSFYHLADKPPNLVPIVPHEVPFRLLRQTTFVASVGKLGARFNPRFIESDPEVIERFQQPFCVEIHRFLRRQERHLPNKGKMRKMRNRGQNFDEV
jgi:hypothetical protein